MKPKKALVTLADGTQILNEDKRIASTSMRVHIPTQVADEKTSKALGEASMWFFGNPKNTVQDNVNVPAQEQKLIVTDDRYVYANFRALSEIFLMNRGLDFSTPGVLKSATEMLKGKTVYPNHQFGDIYNALGSVADAVWDEKGEKSGGVPGINCQIKIDAFLNYRIACGLMMNPPSINSMSLTVLFAFEYSHPQMDRWKFWEMLGEEVDGEVVRMIVTEIKEFFEASLVSVGEDRLAKHQGNEPEGEEESFSAANTKLPTNSNEEKTMKIEKTERTELGIEFDGDDVPETEIFKAAKNLAAKNKEFQGINLTELKAQAATAATLVAKHRTEVTRLAKLAELGAEEGELDEVVSMQINESDADKLIKLETYYQKKAADRFPTMLRSSVEGSDAVEQAGNVNKKETKKPLPKVKY